MKLSRSILAVLCLVLGATGSTRAAGLVEFGLSAESPVLGRPIPYAIYKPFPSPMEGEHWPVVYLLHGLTGADGDWFTWGNLAPLLDAAIAEGRIKPMVVVAPGAGDSWYVDNPDAGGLGAVATALTSDLIAAVEQSLPVATCREGRAIGGVSMGGVGAAALAIEHPDLYVAAISLSGAFHQPLVKQDERLQWIGGLYKGAFGTPFDAERFNAANVFNQMGALRRADPKPAFWTFVGDADYADLIAGSTRFHNDALRAGAESHLRIGPGRHFWETWQQAILPALEWVSPRLRSDC
jgi:S-formylglutathione hydrolase FrmB